MTNGTSQGLFIVIAIIIFGIFVLISYLLFKDNLKPTLANIFTDGLEQTEEDLMGIVKEKMINIKSAREDNTYLYAKIREANESKGETEVWVQLKKLKNGTLQLYGSNVFDGKYTSGSSSMTGDLTIPDMIDGLKITSMFRTINDGVFEKAKFDGDLNLPSGLTSIGNYTFYQSIFESELKLPDGLIEINNYAFNYSKFKGELKLPSSLVSIGDRSFYSSKFSGELSLPSSLKKIGAYTFRNSLFTGTLDVSNVEYIQINAFASSKITKVIRGSKEMSDGSAPFNTSGIHPQSIKLTNGSWYNGSNT